MEVSDVIVVMNKGKIEQIGTPAEVYDNPATPFVMSFIAWYILKAVMGIRISAEDEFQGSDIAECGIEAYPEFARGK